ncbi:MAG: glycoside hydrolase family 95 protein, partial [Candidatus Hydrogenedentes bacterium]|nr:glycoside hydrolase family 95 protein [Candidatus Hydrogenedentota bacterium]
MNLRSRIPFTLLYSLLAIPLAGTATAADLLWYRQPTAAWDEALPLGNGRLGAMVFGGVAEEHLQLNEESLWAGLPVDTYPPDFGEHLAQVRELIFAGKLDEAARYGVKHMTESPTSFRSYQPLGDLWIEAEVAQETTSYRRDLELNSGISRVRYTADEIVYTREAFISAVDDVLAMRLSASAPGKINARVRLSREKDMTVTAGPGPELRMDGQIVDVAAPEGYDDNPGGSGPGGAHMRFAGRLAVMATGGSVGAEGDALAIRGADEAVILFSAATDYSLEKMNFDREIDPAALAEARVRAAQAKSWATLRADHEGDHRSFYDRVSLDLGTTPAADLPTDERLARVKAGEADPALAALYFQYGRYLLMDSSRAPGRLPANLQGIWNQDMWAAWESDYHLNINLQMNYWPADLCNLAETVAPLNGWLQGLSERGRESAKRLYGADGWLSYHATNVFGRT